MNCLRFVLKPKCNNSLLFRCARLHYQNKDLHNLSQSENFIYTRERKKIREILSKIRLVLTVKFVWKGVLSSEIVEIT